MSELDINISSNPLTTPEIQRGGIKVTGEILPHDGETVTKLTPTDNRRKRRAMAMNIKKDLSKMQQRQAMANKYSAELSPLSIEELKALNIKNFSRTKVLVWGHIIDEKQKELDSKKEEQEDKNG